MSESLKERCREAVLRIHCIPFSDWPEPGLLEGVLYEEFSESQATDDVRELRRLLERIRRFCLSDMNYGDEVDSALARTAHYEQEQL